ncbi:molybdopterin converting factor, subunit 2 [Gloeomargarita lithophora Alchichica-D10]|uniref:Molybdopterin converting factor, subunit 2 n=1 Tax=Gloeomargarita lithophora Alchichica-D10 TaxID=1188229 RepID=A0A1J0ADR5_9CYAN|nr:molybdenum cofactor biosynthesis protein MoaE [Gloeomargarita lithophora]APB34086.1 molybdopterin converting factor, subunit 2 [Gloeomargarita lithophora Alchichica-D10]
MIQFTLSSTPIYPYEMGRLLANSTVGALVTFEGWVRNHNEGKTVLGLEYEVYETLAQSEGDKILQEAQIKFNLCGAVACHRQGYLDVGEVAVWVGTTGVHRGAAFVGTRYIINGIKSRLPIWKKEFYLGEKPQWILCQSNHSV